MKRINTVLIVVCFTLLLKGLYGQGTESFDNSTATASYLDGSFTGDAGFTWTYGHSRNEGDFPINGNGLMLRRASDSYLEASIPGGIGNFSFDYRKAFTGAAARQLELIVNGVQVTTTDVFGDESGADATIHNFSFDVNEEGAVTVMIKNVGTTTTNRQTVLDNIAWTGFGGGPVQVATPVFNPPSGTYYESFEVTITSATVGASIFYSFDSETGPWIAYDGANKPEVSSSALIWAYATAAGMDDSNIANANYNLPAITEVTTIAALRSGLTDGTVYKLTGDAVVTFAQSFRNQKWIQDQTGAILIDDQPGNITGSYEINDGVTNIIGTLAVFGNMLQITAVTDATGPFSPGFTIDPQLISMNQFLNNFSDFESQLVKLENVSFMDADGVLTFANGIVYPITDGVQTGDFRATFFGVDYIGTVLPEGGLDITGILNERTSNPIGKFITARNLGDFQAAAANPPTITNIVQTPATDINSSTTVSVSADVAPGDAAIDFVQLKWGTSSGSYPNLISMLQGTGNTYTTQTNIPAQADGTTVYYVVHAEDLDGETATSTEQSYLVSDPSGADLLLLSENFDYSIGSLLVNNGWNAHSGSGTNSIAVTSGLTFDGYANSNIGGAASVTNNGEDVHIVFDEQTTGAIYASFIIRAGATNSAGYFLHLGQTTIGNTFFTRVWTNATGTGLGIGASAPSTYVPIDAETNTLVVVKLNLSSKVSSLYVFSTFPAEEPAAPDATFTETANYSNVGSIALRQYNASQNIIVDGIRVATNWELAVAAAEPNIGPTISNVVQVPANDILPNTTVDVAADVTAGDAAITEVSLQWGLSAGNYPNTIPMSVVNDNTYGTDQPIPAQTGGTTVYYVVYAADADGNSTLSSAYSYTVIVLEPVFNAVPNQLTGFNYTPGNGPSAAQSYQVTGYNLVGNGLIDVTAPASYEISVDNSNWASQLVLQYFDGELLAQPRTIYVRLKAGLGLGVYLEQITHSGPSIDDVFVSVSGEVADLPVATYLAFNGFPANGTPGNPVTTFTVQAFTDANELDMNFTGTITLAKESGPGNISGTLSKAAVSGVATFNDIVFDEDGTYTIAASSGALTPALSNAITILAPPENIIAFWDFNDETLNPTLGEGTASNTGGTSTAWAAGLTGNPDRAWNTATYPEQSTASGTAGVVFMVSTQGYQDIQMEFHHRASGTASRWAQFEYTIDGGTNWVVLENNGGSLSPSDTFYPYLMDFTAIPEVNNNPGFGVRVVSIFSPVAFDQNGTLSYGPNEAYQRANIQSGPPGTGTGTGNYSPNGTWRFDDVTFSGNATTGTLPVALAVVSVNGGIPPTVSQAFSVLVQSRDANGITAPVNVDTDVSLSLATGNGTLSGTLTGTIPAGSSSVSFNNVAYNTAETGVSITASATAGMALTQGTSALFEVLPAASQLAFVNFPSTGQVNVPVATFTVEARRPNNTVDNTFSGAITLQKASGSGNLSGTLSVNAVAGVATFSNVAFDETGSYTLTASASGLSQATSTEINISGLIDGIITQWDFNGPSADGVPGGTNSPEPSTGMGTAALTGGITATFASGTASGGSTDPETTSPPNYAWNTAAYPAQGTNPKTAGVVFAVSTLGYQNIEFMFDQRLSNTAANTWVVQYTLDYNATSPVWVDGETFTFVPQETGTGDIWYNQRTADFSGVTGLNNNANAAFRIVSGFDPVAGEYLAARSTSNYSPNGTSRYDMVTVSGITGSIGAPVQLAITSINGGVPPTVNQAFSVTVQSRDENSVPSAVTENTTITLSLTTGTGSLGGTLTATINAGSSSVTFTNVTYNTAETGVSITASATSGMALTPATSAQFEVLGAATQLAFVNFPGSGNLNQPVATFTVEARRPNNTVDNGFTGLITLTKASGPGNISGTLSLNAVAGIATFSSVSFDQSGDYTLTASATGLTSATSSVINIIDLSDGVIAQWNFNGPSTDAIPGGVLSPEPSLGAGVAGLAGGVSATFASGTASGGSTDPETTSPPNYAWNTSSYPAQGTNPKTAGVEFAVSTLGYQNIEFMFDQRLSNTAANTWVVQYTLDKGAASPLWVDAEMFTFVPQETGTGDIWYNQRTVSFSDVPGLNNNPDAAFRIVSDFDPVAGEYLAARSTSNYTPNGTSRFDMVTVSGIAGGALDPIQLAVTNVNGGVPPTVNQPFTVSVQSRDENNVPSAVTVNTQVTLSLATGTGNLGGTLTATITAGTSSVTFNNVTYSLAEAGVSITATATSGMTLTPGTSALFEVLPAATQLAFDNFPENGTVNMPVATFTVEALRPDNTVDVTYTGSITLSKASGAGDLGGTLVKNAVAGVATFTDITFDEEGEYTLTASATGLTSATSTVIAIIGQPEGIIVQWNFNGPAIDEIPGGTESPEPSSGSGVAGLTGGITTTFASGTASGGSSDPETTTPPNYAWNSATYPEQGTNPKTAGVVFTFSSIGYENLTFMFDQRLSNTAANTWVVQYTLDASATNPIWIDAEMFTFVPQETGTGDVWYNQRTVDLSEITELNNNPNAGIRIVSDFDPVAGEYLAARSTSNYSPNGTSRFDMVTVMSDMSVIGDPVQLAITNINGGVPPTVNTPFSLTVESRDENNNPANVTEDTEVTLSLETGTGALSGTLTGTIAMGSNSIVFDDLLYDTVEEGVSITATATDGMVLNPATSELFEVIGAATQLAFVDVPESGTINLPIAPFSVEAQREDGSLDLSYGGLITLSKASGPGNVNGTLEREAVNGVAVFDDISFDAEGVYSLMATATGLDEAVSSMIEIAGVPSGIIAQWDFNDETLDPNIGEGTAANVGGTSTSWAAGVTGNPDRGWNTSAYPDQATASGTAGVEFFVSTVGYENISLQFFHRGSGTASRYATLQYTVDGSTWIDYDTYLNGPPHDTFFEHNYDFNDIPDVNDNPSFGVRMLAIFSPEPFTDGSEPFTEWGANEAYRAVRDDRNYGATGTWRFDDVTFSGDVIIGLPAISPENIRVYTAWNQIVVETDHEEVLQMQVYNLMGQPMMLRELSGQRIYRMSHNLPRAAYIIRLIHGKGMQTEKIMVH